MSTYYRHLIKTSSYAYLINSYPSIIMAFDFRKLRSAYSGNAIKVLRTSDNTEQDFPFVANEVVGSDVLNFVGWNLFAYSEQLQNPYWAKTNLTVTTDSVVAPDGLTTGDVLFETTTSGVHVMQRILTFVAGNEYTVSFWIKGQGRDNVRIATAVNLSWDGVTAPIAWLNLATGTIVSQNAGFGGTVQISSAQNGWYFVTYKVKAVNNDTSRMIELVLSPNGTNTSYVGDVTKGIAVWGLQVTESSILLPYRKTDANPEGHGSLSKGYNQATGGGDVINSTIIRQPIIVNGGNLITDGGKLALQGGATLGLRSTGTVALSAYSDLFFTFGINVSDVTTGQRLIETSNDYLSNNGAFVIFIQVGLLLVTQRTSSGQFTRKTYPISTGRQLITVRFRTGQTATNASQVWINGVEITGTVTLTNNSIALSNQVIYLFARNANTVGFLGKYQNFTMFTDPMQRTGIETNINDYYGYY